MKPESQRPVAVEDLLRLKRAERPPAAFWDEFDRELRAKQLAALVAKRPWWHRLPTTLPGRSRLQLPFGATAILAATFFVVGQRNETAEVPSQLGELRSDVTFVAAPVGAGNEFLGHIAEPSIPSHPGGTGDEAPALAQLEHSRSSIEPAPVALVTSPTTLGPGSFDSVPASNYSAELVPTQRAESIVASMLLKQPSAFEVRAPSGRTAVEPLQHITPPSERSRSRLLTAMVSMTSSEASTRTSERHANRISEEQLYDQINRFGARGAGVNMKF